MGWGREEVKATWPNPLLQGPPIIVGAGGAKTMTLTAGYTDEDEPTMTHGSAGAYAENTDGASRKYAYFLLPTPVRREKFRAIMLGSPTYYNQTVSVEPTDTVGAAGLLLKTVHTPFDFSTLTWDNQDDLNISTVYRELLSHTPAAYDGTEFDVGYRLTAIFGFSNPTGFPTDTPGFDDSVIYGFQVKFYPETPEFFGDISGHGKLGIGTVPISSPIPGAMLTYS